MRLTSLIFSALMAVATFPLLAFSAPAASSFVISSTLTYFSINLSQNSSDVYFYFSSPAYSWVAVGIGSRMKGSLMFVMYSAADNQHVTLSPRIATGHTEPAFTKDVTIELLDGSSIQNDSLVVNALCRGCRSWPGGSIDTSSKVQPFMYAFGPNNPLASNSQSVGLRRHRRYGHFTMDMVQATGPGGVPPATTQMSGAAFSGPTIHDGDKASIGHGVLLAFIALILIPLDVIVAGLFRWARVHIVTTSLLLLLSLTGFGLGIYVSLEYIRSQKFNTAHQILGLLIIAAWLASIPIGAYIHVLRKRAKRTGEIINMDRIVAIHTWLARITWVVAIINGGLGLPFSESPNYTKYIYAFVTVAMALVMIPVYFCIFRRSKKRQRETVDNSATEIALANYYAEPGQKPY